MKQETIIRLENKVAIVIGGGRDTGRTCAIRLARDGAKVAISYQASARRAKRNQRHRLVFCLAGTKPLATRRDRQDRLGT